MGQCLLRTKLHAETTRDIETAAYAGRRVQAAIAALKPCATKQQRDELLTLVAAVAPPRLAPRDPNGMLRRVSKFVDMRRGRRSKNQGGRHTAALAAK